MKGEKINISFTFILTIIVLSSFVSASYQGVVIGEGISGNFTFYNNNTYVTYVTGNASSFNQTYQNFAYNQTTAGQQYFLNLSGTNANQNLNIGNNNLTSNWFFGKFNWLLTLGSYLQGSFDGSTLTIGLNGTQLNTTITQLAIPGNNSFNETVVQRYSINLQTNITSVNNTLNELKLNRTDQLYNDTTLINNLIAGVNTTGNIQNLLNATGIYQRQNATYDNLLNQSCPSSQVVNGTLPNGTLQCTTVSASIPINGTRLTIANITNFDYNHNQTAPANAYTDTASANLQSNISAVNTSLKLQIDNKLDRNGSNANENINIGLFNFTGNYSFFDFVGSSLRRTIKGWFTDLDVSGNVSVGGNVSASYFVGDGSLLTGITATVPNNGITVTANNVTSGIFPGQNNFTAPQIFNANVTIRNFDSIVLNESNKYITSNETCVITIAPTSRLELC